MLSRELKVALRGDMVMAPNSTKTKEEEKMMIKVEERSMDMFAPAWVQENTQVLKKKVEGTQELKTKEKSQVLKTKVVATKISTPKKALRKEENPSRQSTGEEKAKNIETLAETDQVQIWIF